MVQFKSAAMPSLYYYWAISHLCQGSRRLEAETGFSVLFELLLKSHLYSPRVNMYMLYLVNKDFENKG